MTAFTELPPGFAFFAAIFVYDLILLLRGELSFVSVTPFYEPDILEGLLDVVEEYHEALSQSEAGPAENSWEMEGFATGGETGWDLLFSWDFPDFS